MDFSNLIHKNNNQSKLIDWNKSIGKIVKFQYKDIRDRITHGELIIKNKKNNLIIVEYNNIDYTIPFISFFNGNIKKHLFPYTFLYQIGDIIKDEKRDMTITSCYLQDRENRKEKRYQYHCNKCQFNGDISESNIRVDGCKCCSNKIVVPGINDIVTTDPWMVKYFQDGEKEAQLYTCRSGKKINPKCPDCGRIKENEIPIHLIHKNHGISCICSDNISYPEKFFISFLNQLNVDYIYQLSSANQGFDWIKGCRYDFYLKHYNIIIETDGDQHNDSHGNWVDINKQKEIDEQKEAMALEYVDDYIHIDCRISEAEFIKTSILNSKISSMFDLSEIDWKKCDEYATKNLIREVCLAWKDDYSLSSKLLSDMFNIHQDTISKYLQKGAKLGWCDYNPKEAIRKASLNSKGSRKPIKVYNDSFYKEYISTADFARNSLQDIGIQFCQTSIPKHIKNHTMYHGFYIENI